MYIKEIKIENYGAIESMNYKFPFNEKGNPLPVVLVGKNGTGKTLFFSNILHAIIEIKRKFYNSLSEVSGDKYYRVGSKLYIKSSENYSYVKVDFDDAYSVDLMVKDYDTFKSTYDDTLYPNIKIDNTELEKDGFYSEVTKPNTNVFDDNIFLYFPVDRYYIPTWENKQNENLTFITDEEAFLGEDKYNIVQYNLLNEIEPWILDVIIDKLLYESIELPINTSGIKTTKQTYVGRNTNIQKAINNILSKIYLNEEYTSVRIGVSKKQHRNISIIGTLKNGKEEEISPKFSNMSSGQIMILGIFSAIIRAYDKNSNNQSIDFKDISGIVMIDEIDTHLHSDLLKEVLPELISIFPKLQFIISSHSPFFLLGMNDKFQSDCEFVAMPTGTVLDNIDKFDELRKCYSIIDDSYKSVLEAKEKYEDQIKDFSKPLIITEGKTDWKHLKHALIKLKEAGQFEDLEVNFLEYEYEFSDSKLETLLNQLKNVPNNNKIIGIFDSDTNVGNKYKDVECFKNNVYGCCITDTQGYDCGISIELLYSKEDLTREDKEKRRLYLSNEFKVKSHTHVDNPNIVCNNNTIIDANKRNMIKIVDSGVYNSDEESLALSKDKFANYIYNEQEPFDAVSVNGFNDIFNLIKDIVDGKFDKGNC